MSMNFESLFTYLLFTLFAFVAGSFIVKIFKHGGLKSAMFGAPIVGTVGEAPAAEASS